jgi:hypothetical protein
MAAERVAKMAKMETAVICIVKVVRVDGDFGCYLFFGNADDL